MINTSDLIESLVADAKPVRRLHPPVARAAVWLTFAALMLALIAVTHGVRADFTYSLRQATVAINLGAALATGALASIAAFIVSVPGRSPMWVWLPAPALAVWVLNIGYGCLTAWVNFPAGAQIGDEASCFGLAVLTGLPLSLVMLIMLRHAASVAPRAVAITGSLAVAALTAVALSLFHNHDASALVLVWNLGVAALLVALGAWQGRRIFSWVAPR